MKKKLLFIADSLEKVNLKSDSSLALAESAIQQNWEVFWCEAKNVHFINEDIILNKVYEINHVSLTDIRFSLIKQKLVSFATFDFCFIRKDPPFDEGYKDLCWILATQAKVKIINPPEVLLAYHEKSLHWRALADGVLQKHHIISTCLSADLEVIEEYCKINEDILSNGLVCKPWLGHGGEDVQLFDSIPKFIDSLQQQKKANKLIPKYLIQPYLAEIQTEGDRRVLIANGKVIGDFVRLPAQGKIASNLAQGGTAILREMTQEQRIICEELGKFLKNKNIFLAGLDLIGTRIGEINITSPTGLRTYESLTGKNIAYHAFELMVNN